MEPKNFEDFPPEENNQEQQGGEEEQQQGEKPLTEEEKEKTKSRIVSDAELVKGGAEIREDGSISPTESQMEDAKREMESENPLYEAVEVNGKEIVLNWDEGYGDYVIYFPQIEVGEEASERGVADSLIRISEDRETAQKVIDFAKKEAEQTEDVYELNKKVEDFIRNLRDGEEE